jgi:hypothetical protein
MKRTTRTAIIFLQKECLRLNEISIQAHQQGFKELYDEIDKAINDILETIDILKYE